MALSALFAWGVAAWIRRRAETLHLVQTPNHRSSHAQPTPHGGGLGIVLAGSLSGSSLLLLSDWSLGWVLLGLALLLALVGLRDDVQHLPASVRFGVQVAVCTGVLYALGSTPSVVYLNVTPLLSILDIQPFHIGTWAMLLLLLLAGVWWINLFNFMDGIDGIAASQAIFMLMTGAGLAAWVRPDIVTDPAWVWMLCLAGATVGFLRLNWPPAKIFMGDVGSTYLAFMIFIFALISVQAKWFSPLAGASIWLILGAIFVVDSSITLFIRIARGERWYEAHRSHAYQRLSRHWAHAGFNHKRVTLLTIGINLLWLAPLAWACTFLPQWVYAFVVLAYVPLLVAAVLLGAGKPDEA